MDAEPPSYFLSLHFLTAFQWGWGLLALAVLLLFSAFFSAAEVAFFSIRRKQIENSRESSIPGIEKVNELLRNRWRLMTTFIIGNTICNVAVIILCIALSRLYIYPYLQGWSFVGIPLHSVVTVLAISLIIILFGEVIPRVMVANNYVAFATRTVGIVRTIQTVFQPLTIPLQAVNQFLEDRYALNDAITIDTLSQVLEITNENEQTTEEDKKILESIVTFGNTETQQVMTPRVDMYALQTKMNFPEVVAGISQHGFSRIPVYQSEIDEIKGILYSKDLLPYLHLDEFDWTSVLRPSYFVPENMKLDDLLSEFQKRKTHIAIVVDEYGGTSGLVTLEDVLEEVVGDIADEFDEEDIMYSKLDEDNYVFDGKTSLKDFYRIMQVEESEVFNSHRRDSGTLAGFVMEIAGRKPNRRQQISFENYIFTVESIDNKRIKQIKVTRNQPTLDPES
ncbi:MAG: gliding motility-associated protein GldE [Weeksellaceae bacterium]|nr:gliding motility-associated protein GldE [Weeksellaceae bacterium]